MCVGCLVSKSLWYRRMNVKIKLNYILVGYKYNIPILILEGFFIV